MHDEEALWRQVCAEIEAINTKLPGDDKHEIPTWDAWCGHFGVPADVWVAMLEPLEPIGAPEFMTDTIPLPPGEGQWWPWENSDYLTILRAAGRLAAKTHRRVGDKWDTTDYQGGYWHEYEITPKIDSLEVLAATLTRLESMPEHFVIRGEPTRPAPVRREYQQEGSFRCVDRRWLCIDIDKCAGDSVTDAIAMLPEYFQGVACWYQYSASHGVKPGVRVHLWYWLDRRVCCFSLRQWAKPLAHIVDATLYEPVHVHYTAAPIFIDAPDPVAQRSGMLPGRPELVLPPDVVNLATFTERQKQQQDAIEAQRQAASSRRFVEGAFAATDRQRYALRALERCCDDIRTSGKGNRHLTLIAKATAMGELLDHIDESLVRAELLAAANDAFAGENRQQEAEKTVRDGMDRGKRNPRDLSHIGVVELPAGFDDAAFDALFQPAEPAQPERKELYDMRYMRVCLCELKKFEMPHHYNPGLLMDELVWCPGEPHTEAMAKELSEWLNMRRRRVESESQLPEINKRGDEL
jgi:hypothetical protein